MPAHAWLKYVIDGPSWVVQLSVGIVQGEVIREFPKHCTQVFGPGQLLVWARLTPQELHRCIVSVSQLAFRSCPVVYKPQV